MSKFGGGIGVPTKEERLKEAAEIHLRLGQIRRYCELMVELGEVKYAIKAKPRSLTQCSKSQLDAKYQACLLPGLVGSLPI